ncbi:MAG: DUF2497 domain-containing protein [Sandarakinorhabdus sp.]|nr:DUF2497 domain-containing protein [Sandarakinorhabdus sp.]
MTDSPPDLPADLDAILESIRARVVGEVAVPPPPLAAPQRPGKLLPDTITAAPAVTVDALITALLEPLLRQWLDAHLPEICERAAIAEIRRLTGQPEPQPEAQPQA